LSFRFCRGIFNTDWFEITIRINKKISIKMETKEQANVPKKKKMNDFVLTFLGIAALIAALFLLKYIIHAMQLI
jgi:hypothetical protein